MEIEKAVKECVGVLFPKRSAKPDRALLTVVHKIAMAHGEGPINRDLLTRVPDMRIWNTIGQKRLASRIVNALKVTLKPGETPGFKVTSRHIQRLDAEEELRRGVPAETILQKTGRSEKWLKGIATEAGIDLVVGGNRVGAQRRPKTIQTETLLREGRPPLEVAKIVGLSQQWVRQIGHKAGIQMEAQTNSRTPASLQAEELLKAGMSAAETQEKTGLSMATIRTLANSLGVRATPRALAEDRSAKAKEMLAQGVDADEIVQKLDLTRRAVIRLAKDLDVPVRRRSRLRKEQDEAVELFKANLTFPEIVARSPLSPSYLRAFAAKHGFEIITAEFRSDAQRIAIEAFKAGKSLEEVAALSGLSMAQVRKHRRKAGFATSTREHTPTEIIEQRKHQANTLLLAGSTVSETAKTTGLSISTVRRLWVEMNANAAPKAAPPRAKAVRKSASRDSSKPAPKARTKHSTTPHKPRRGGKGGRMAAAAAR